MSKNVLNCKMYTVKNYYDVEIKNKSFHNWSRFFKSRHKSCQVSRSVCVFAKFPDCPDVIKLCVSMYVP